MKISVYFSVALNYQKKDTMCFLNDAKFSQNGGCGYVLKPDFLTKPNPHYCPTSLPNNISLNPKVIALTIISGQHIPRRANQDRFTKGNFVGPYVRARILGHPDEKETKDYTEAIKNNGFNPFWNERFQFYVKAPALAFLELTVKGKQYYSKLGDKMTRDPVLGGFVCPINLLRQGK